MAEEIVMGRKHDGGVDTNMVVLDELVEFCQEGRRCQI